MPSAGVPGVRLSLDDPTAHIDQDWTVTFEGVLPGAGQIETNVSTSDAYHSLTLSTGTQAPSGAANGLSTPGYLQPRDRGLDPRPSAGRGDRGEQPG